MEVCGKVDLRLSDLLDVMSIGRHITMDYLQLFFGGKRIHLRSQGVHRVLQRIDEVLLQESPLMLKPLVKVSRH